MLRCVRPLRFQATRPRLSGGALYHPPKLEDIPSSSLTKGFFGSYNEGAKVFRFVDLKWMMSRSVELGREHYIAAPVLFSFLWLYCWKGIQIMLYADGKPPRAVDWNTEEAGYLPEGFEPTKLTRQI